MSVHETAVQVLAQFPDPGGQGEDFGKSSPVGLLLMVLLAIGIVLLVRSMSKHLKKLPKTFDETKAAAAAPARVKRTESADGGVSADDAAGTGRASDEDADSSASDDSATSSNGSRD